MESEDEGDNKERKGVIREWKVKMRGTIKKGKVRFESEKCGKK